MLLKPSQSLKFWRPQDVKRLDFRVPIIRNDTKDQRGDWPGKFPSWSEIQTELAASRSAYIRISDKKDGGGWFLDLLVGRFLLRALCAEGRQGTLRANLITNNGIKFANNQQRKMLAVNGVRIEHLGIALINGPDFVSCYARPNSYFDSGQYVSDIAALKTEQSEKNALQECQDDEEIDVPLLESEEHLLRSLETYVAAEFALEEQKARETPGFAYIDVSPERRKATIRKFFRLTLTENDYSRLKELNPKMLAVQVSDDVSLQLQVDDIEADDAKHQIIVSVEQQLASGEFPLNGELHLAAIPTLQKVRAEVIDNLRQRMTPNPWLIPVAADSYTHAPLVPAEVPIPPTKFPPNASQVAAIRAGAGTEDYMLVLGPPGTGKTTVILRWVDYFVSQNKRILISSQNNAAVDNVLERLATDSRLTCVRLGNESKVSSTIHDLLIDNCASTLQNKLVAGLTERLDILSQALTMLREFAIAINTTGSPPALLVDKADLIKRFIDTQLESLSKHVFDKCGGAGVLAFELIIDCLSKLQNRQIQTEQTLSNYQQTVGETELRHRGLIDHINEKCGDFGSRRGWLKPAYFALSWWYGLRSRQTQKKHEIVLAAMQAEKDVTLERIETEKAFFNEKIGTDISSKRLALGRLIDEISHLNDQAKTWHAVISNQRQEGLYSILINFVDVVGATCIGINTSRFFKDALFDAAIIDEAGQIQLHNLVVPLSRVPKAILVGDHKQLPPVVMDELKQEVDARAEADSVDIGTELLEKSWFEILWNRAPDDRKAMLDTQFRCPSLISDYISDAFYDGKYFAGPGMADKKPLFSFFNSTLVFIDTSSLPLNQRQESSRRGEARDELIGNRIETEIVLKLLTRALAERPELGTEREIGIIVPYKLHVREIQREVQQLQKRGQFTISTPVVELIASVDSFQGQERDLIVFTFTRSNAGGRVGFLADWRRLNVAMTRAKKQIVMIGDFSTLTKQSRPGAPDVEFKQAMVKLQRFVKQKCQLIDAADWIGRKATKKAEVG